MKSQHSCWKQGQRMIIKFFCARPVKKTFGFLERMLAVSKIPWQEEIPMKICSAPERSLPEYPGTPV